VRGLLQTDHLGHERGRGLALLLPGVTRRVQSFLQFHQDPKGRHPVGQQHLEGVGFSPTSSTAISRARSIIDSCTRRFPPLAVLACRPR
jgi:hypothetical protein